MKELKCPKHVGIILIRCQTTCGIHIYHKNCPLCVSENIQRGTVSSHQVAPQLQLLDEEYHALGDEISIVRVRTELRNLRQDFASNDIYDLDTKLFHRLVKRAMPTMKELMERSPAAALTTASSLLEQVKFLRVDLIRFNDLVQDLDGETNTSLHDVEAYALHGVIDQLWEALRNLPEHVVGEEYYNPLLRDELDELQTDLGMVKRTIKNLPDHDVSNDTSVIRMVLWKVSSFLEQERKLIHRNEVSDYDDIPMIRSSPQRNHVNLISEPNGIPQKKVTMVDLVERLGTEIKMDERKSPKMERLLHELKIQVETEAEHQEGTQIRSINQTTATQTEDENQLENKIMDIVDNVEIAIAMDGHDPEDEIAGGIMFAVMAIVGLVWMSPYAPSFASRFNHVLKILGPYPSQENETLVDVLSVLSPNAQDEALVALSHLLDLEIEFPKETRHFLLRQKQQPPQQPSPAKSSKEDDDERLGQKQQPPQPPHRPSPAKASKEDDDERLGQKHHPLQQPSPTKASKEDADEILGQKQQPPQKPSPAKASKEDADERLGQKQHPLQQPSPAKASKEDDELSDIYNSLIE
eukprot:scaffold114072_cov51-Attheya_sp.AAC.2